MAEKIKDWQSTILWAIGLIFVGGIGYKTLEVIDAKTVANAAKIEKVDSKVDKNYERIHKAELTAIEINTKLDDIPEIKRDMEKLTDYLMQYDFNKKDR